MIGADDLCEAAQAVLVADLPVLVDQLGLTDNLGVIEDWTQVPTLAALTSARLPAGAITSPGLVDQPTQKSRTEYDATWRIVVGVYARDTDFNTTARKCRRWAALVRAVLVDNPSLGGISSTLKWVGEEYAELPRRSEARTIGGCAVAFDVTAKNVAQIGLTLPTVESTISTINVRPQE